MVMDVSGIRWIVMSFANPHGAAALVDELVRAGVPRGRVFVFPPERISGDVLPETLPELWHGVENIRARGEVAVLVVATDEYVADTTIASAQRRQATGLESFRGPGAPPRTLEFGQRPESPEDSPVSGAFQG